AASGEIFDCLCGKSGAAVTPHGKLNLCTSIYRPLYDLTSGSLAEGWQSLVELVAGARGGPQYECGGCRLAGHCDRGPMDGWLESGAFDAPCIPYFRELAESKSAFLEPSGEDPHGDA